MRRALPSLLLLLGCSRSPLEEPRAGQHAPPAASQPLRSDPRERAWGLDRINQRALPLDGVPLPRGLGAGVHVYLLDTGVERQLETLRSQLQPLPDHSGDFVHDAHGTRHGALDCNGHGTHLAGIIAGHDTGVATAVALHALRVADCGGRGQPEAMLEAAGWLEAHAALPAVVLISLQYRDAPALGAAMARLVAAGLVVVAAAGESLDDACQLWPSGAADVLTVAGTDRADQARKNSNWGACVKLWAPGAEIGSLQPTPGAGLVTKSGSSMAAAFVAGVAALYLGNHPRTSPRELSQLLRAAATPEAVQGLRARFAELTPRALLFVPASWYEQQAR